MCQSSPQLLHRTTAVHALLRLLVCAAALLLLLQAYRQLPLHPAYLLLLVLHSCCCLTI
jgi:hypothetical protein